MQTFSVLCSFAFKEPACIERSLVAPQSQTEAGGSTRKGLDAPSLLSIFVAPVPCKISAILFAEKVQDLAHVNQRWLSRWC